MTLALSFYSIEGLRAYKEKFDPIWRSKYLASPGGFALPAFWPTSRPWFKDRLRSEHDYRVNLKAELEIRRQQLKVS